MEQFKITRIGTVRSDNNGMRLELEKQYAPAFECIDGFSHLNIL